VEGYPKEGGRWQVLCKRRDDDNGREKREENYVCIDKVMVFIEREKELFYHLL
jgi:hypothetical protein